VLHISIWEIEAFSGGLSGDGLNFGPPVTAWTPQLGGMECGWYGSACTCVSQWASAEIFSGGQKRHFACQFQLSGCWRCNV